MVIGPGHGDLELVLRVRAREPRLGLVHAALEPQRADHLRHHRVVAVVADAHLHLVLEVDALDVLEEAVHEVLARLLAVGDDVDAGVLLLLQPEQRRVALGLRELRAAGASRRPELVGLGEPGGLGQAAGDGGLEHGSSSRLCLPADVQRTLVEERAHPRRRNAPAGNLRLDHWFIVPCPVARRLRHAAASVKTRRNRLEPDRAFHRLHPLLDRDLGAAQDQRAIAVPTLALRPR